MESLDGFESSQHMLKAQAHVWKHMSSFVNSMSLKCAIQLGIPDVIHEHGKPMTLAELADAIPVKWSKSASLGRLMRLLVHTEFITEDGDGAYSLTPPSLLLLKDKPLSVAPLVLSTLDPVLADPWHHLARWFATDETTPFVTAHGAPLFAFAEQDIRVKQFFNEGMASDARLVATVIVRDCRHVFDGIEFVVDVGGGTGAAARALTGAFPGLQCTVLDLPHVVAGLSGTERVSFVGGDMFEVIPPADAVLLKWILHDWNDEECVKILEKCKPAIKSKGNGGKVVIVDMVVMNHKENDEATEIQLQWDMEMMVLTSGKERTEEDWAKLIEDAGFKSYNITPLIGLRFIIEVFP